MDTSLILLSCESSLFVKENLEINTKKTLTGLNVAFWDVATHTEDV